MSASPFFVSKFVVRNLKQVAVQSLPQISSSHLSEGIAAALGFKSCAELRSALSEHPTALAQRPSNASMVRRQKQLGHVDLPDNLKVLLDLDRSYSPFKTYALRRKRGIRWTAWRMSSCPPSTPVFNSECSACRLARTGGQRRRVVLRSVCRPPFLSSSTGIFQEPLVSREAAATLCSST